MCSEPICCEFTYDRFGYWGMTHKCTAVGVVCTWPELRKTFSRQGSSCPALNALHFRTISKLGPKLFAVSLANLKVFYNDGYRWHQYRTARQVRLGMLKDFTELLLNDNDDDGDGKEDWSEDESDGKDPDDDLGRQAKDLSSKNDSIYEINPAILYFCLLRILLIIELQNSLIQCQSFLR